MTDPTTTNLALAQPLRGSDVGTWDTPVNNNSGILDNALAATTSIALTNANVVLSAAQYQCLYITFTGTITSNIQITLPAIGSMHTIQNRTAGSFTVTLLTTAGGEAIACPPYEPFDVLTDGTNVRFRNLGRVGSYWDYAGSSVPAWVSGCTVPPYLNCDGTAFSSATYPALATIFGGTTLPDSRGRVRYDLNQGTGRLTAINGNTLFGGGGSEFIGQANLPNYNLTTVNPTLNHTAPTFDLGGSGILRGWQSGDPASTQVPYNNGVGVNAFTIPSAGSGASYATPGYIGGLTMVRAA